MSLKCTSDDQELLSIDFDAEAWDELRARNRKNRILQMACCGADVTLRQAKLGTRYSLTPRKVAVRPVMKSQRSYERGR